MVSSLPFEWTVPFEFKKRCPDQYDALIQCSAFVNYRRVEIGEPLVLALLLIGSAPA
jgi:hypothetical protein